MCCVYVLYLGAFVCRIQQERAMREMRGDRGGNTAGHGNAPPMQPPPAPPTGMGLDRGGRPGGKVNIYISK